MPSSNVPSPNAAANLAIAPAAVPAPTAAGTAPTVSPATDVSRLSYEQALAELERVVDLVESGQASLEASMAQYERGMALVQRCQHLLAQAEDRIAVLTGRPGAISVAMVPADQFEGPAG